MSLTNGSGELLITKDGLAASVQATVSVNPSLGITFTGTFGLSINNGTKAVHQVFDVNGRRWCSTCRPGSSCGSRATTSSSASADSTSPAASRSSRRRTRSGQEGRQGRRDRAGLHPGRRGHPFVVVHDGTGCPGPRRGGMAGSLSIGVTLNVPGVKFMGTIGLDIQKTKASAIDETITVNGTDLHITAPANTNLVKVSGTGIDLQVAGQTLHGDFVFEQVGAGATKRVVAAVAT